MKNVFLDTNLLAYAHDSRAPEKRARAEAVIAMFRQPDYAPVISTQVLQEFYNTLTRKFELSPTLAKSELQLLSNMLTVNMTPLIVLAAADLHAAASISFWDALIIAAAQSADCDELWTEDLQPGQLFGKLKVVNPFAI